MELMASSKTRIVENQKHIMNPRIKSYVEMIRNGAQEALDGTLDVRVFAKSAEMAAQEVSRLLNEQPQKESKEL